MILLTNGQFMAMVACCAAYMFGLDGGGHWERALDFVGWWGRGVMAALWVVIASWIVRQVMSRVRCKVMDEIAEEARLEEEAR